MKCAELFFLKKKKKKEKKKKRILDNVVCCSRDWCFKGRQFESLLYVRDILKGMDMLSGMTTFLNGFYPLTKRGLL